MTDISTIIHQTIHNFDKLPNFDRNNIFNEIVNFTALKATRQEQFKIFFLYNKYQKILNALRMDDIIMAEYLLNYVNQYNSSFLNQESNLGIQTLYNPVVAYYYYKKSNFDYAIKNIDSTINLIEKLYDKGLKNAPFDYVEQIINKSKVLYQKGEIIESFNLSKNLIISILSDNNFYVFDKKFSDYCQNSDELISYINYIFDNILSKYFLNSTLFNQNKSNLKSLFIDVQNFIIKNPNLNYNQLKSNLNLVIGIIDELAIENFEINFNEVLNKNTSCSIAYFIYDYLTQKENPILLNDIIELYYSKKNADSYECFIKKLIEKYDAKIYC